ncbi:membrane protein insertase YidC [Streptomyces sp. AJS327]|uniref:YidC/Oxa1 family membrane protein insertase n=1 Tax=Streptomyces sp. AJS327 TaxID=2545265 RepID=UPI0015DED130|nr:membrane protein insertase YidC [Streptomyces sp. AJS327]MBA0049606.1 membrane protein insertase YidC [Streptomyces sp. AJS327]
MSTLGSWLARLSDALSPLFGASATAAAIVICTLAVRLALHPLARAAVRGERARARLAPELARVQRRHRNDPERLRRELGALHRREGVSPAAGCLPTLLQLPVFFVMYHLCTTDRTLLEADLFGAPLGGRWADALRDGGVLGTHGLVYLGLFSVITAVACWTFVRTRRVAARNAAANADRRDDRSTARNSRNAGNTGNAGNGMTPPGGAALTRLLPLLPFGTLVTAAVVPLAAGLYLATTTAWTAAERAALRAGLPDRAPSGPGRPHRKPS